jgi:hypothetical protein
MNEKSIDQIEGEEISDEAVEAAGTSAAAWTFICTGIQCGSVNEQPRHTQASPTGRVPDEGPAGTLKARTVEPRRWSGSATGSRLRVGSWCG